MHVPVASTCVDRQMRSAIGFGSHDTPAHGARIIGKNHNVGFNVKNHFQCVVSEIKVVSQACDSRAAIIEVTGGEPLLQPGFVQLVEGLRDESSRPVLVETNGSLDISVIPQGVHAIVDMKCPGSGESDRMDLQNLTRLRSTDEVKFVVSDRHDYEWARELVTSGATSSRCAAILFSPAWELMDAGQLASWIVEDHLPVRLQLQLHKLLGVR